MDDNDWSDSDEEDLSEVETSVLLGTPDGAISAASDLTDAAVSRIGGHPAFLASEPPFSSAACKICSAPMQLLVQMWCPFEDSPMDRALYVWGCGVSTCQYKEGSIRAWRGLRYNDAYAVKLEKKKAKQKEKVPEKSAPKTNPFSAGAAPGQSPFGLGAQIFGNSAPPAPAAAVPEESEHETGDEEDSSSDDELLTALATTTLEESPWRSAPSYPPIYLSTSSEYVPAQQKLKLPAGVQVTDPLDDGGAKKSDKDVSWMSEAYENSLEVDHVFERFTKRVGYEGEQCVRYELEGTPLPYASDSIFAALFPLPPAPPLPVTKAAFTVVPPVKRAYDPAAATSIIPPCPVCRAKRVFECQLMPNLINVLRGADADKSAALTDEERRRLVEKELKKDGGGGMEWGTCLVFSCSKDCALDDAGKEAAREAWREEVVLVQWGV